MAQRPSLYSGIVTPRSRRLRTVGVLLLAAIAGMTFYGLVVLMPAIHHAAELHPLAVSVHMRRQLFTRVAAAYAYWAVCGLLICAAMVVAWLDFREVSRTYAAQRRALWEEATRSIATGERAKGRSRDV